MTDDGDQVGSLAEEAAKLFAVLTDGVAAQRPGDDDAPSEHDHDECRICPVCQSIRLARSVTPELREHLGNAALSLAQAATVLLQSVQDAGRDAPEETPVEHVDLSETQEE